MEALKFREMPYERPDGEALKTSMRTLTEKLRAAGSYDAAKAVFLEKETLSNTSRRLQRSRRCATRSTRATSFMTRENGFWNQLSPELEEYSQEWTKAMLASPYRADFEKEYGTLMFLNAEIALKTFSPEIIPELQKENDLTTEYDKLIASAQIPFEGGVYTLSQLSPFKTGADDAQRLAAWKAEGGWYKEHQSELDRIYDELVDLRDTMGKKLGYKGLYGLGYYRMGRNCYGKADVEKFRAAVRKYLVPVAESIYQEQAKRLGKTYPLSFADAALSFRSGNPRPCGDAEHILAHGQKFYDELSPETSAFFRMMRERELLDILSTEGRGRRRLLLHDSRL